MYRRGPFEGRVDPVYFSIYLSLFFGRPILCSLDHAVSRTRGVPFKGPGANHDVQLSACTL